MNPYQQYDQFYVAVDCIIFGFNKENLELLLIKRNFPPQKDKYSLMGGFLNKDESLDKSAQRILEELTGLDDVYLEQLYTYGEVNRDPGNRVISVAYYALINSEKYGKNISEDYHAHWYEINNYPGLIFDHNQMVDKALKRLRRKAKNQPIGFELLPEKFTIPQLQQLYEAIYQQKFDKRNFRKKILDMNVLKKLEEKDKESSKKGAYYYKFDKQKYDKLVEEGLSFEL